jgi:hypothetical protein
MYGIFTGDLTYKKFAVDWPLCLRGSVRDFFLYTKQVATCMG